MNPAKRLTRYSNTLFWLLVATSVLTIGVSILGTATMLHTGHGHGFLQACARIVGTLLFAIGHNALLLVFGGVALVAVGIFVTSILRQVRATKRLLGRLYLWRIVPPPTHMEEASDKAGIAGRVHLVDAKEPFCFTYGWWRPKVCISRRAAELLDREQLLAVLLHEASHLHRKDPLRLLFTQALVEALPWLPVLRTLWRQYVLAREVAADSYAQSAMGEPWTLASAIVTLSREQSQPTWAWVTSILQPSTLEERLNYLIQGTLPKVRTSARLLTLNLIAMSSFILISVLATYTQAVYAAPLCWLV